MVNTKRSATVEFDPTQEPVDGKGWTITWFDQNIDDLTVVPSSTKETFARFSNQGKLTAAVTNKALTTNVATLTTLAAHGFVAGQQVVVSGVGAPFDGAWILVSASGTTFTYNCFNANVVSAAVTPNGSAYVAVLASQTANVTNKVLASNVATLTLPSHTFRVGDRVTVSIADPVFDGTYVLTAAVLPTTSAFGTVSYARTNANVGTAATTGTVTTEMSLVDRLKSLFATAIDVTDYFNSAAAATVLAANNATVVATALASLVSEGVA